MSGSRVRWRGANRTVLLVDGRVADDDGGPATELARPAAWLAPPLVDLQGAPNAEPGEGFGLVLPRQGSDRVGSGHVGALTVGGEGKVIADHLRLRLGGARVLSDGDGPLADLDVLLGALRWAACVGLPVIGRPATPALERGVWAASPEATRRGLAPVFRQGEALGVHRWAAAAEATGATVHLTPLWSAAGVEALRHHQGRGVSLTAGTTPHHAFVVPAPSWRAWPVMGDDADREALVAALRDGTLTTLSSGGRPAPTDPAPLPDQLPGAPDPAVALATSLAHLGPEATARLWGVGPRKVLGLADDEVPGLIAIEPGALITCPLTGLSAPRAVQGSWGLVPTGPQR